MSNNSLVSLLNRVYQGDPDAVTELITGYYPMMYKTALGILGNSSDAQDVVQDASIKLIRNIKQLDNVNSFEPWVKRIVRNEALDYMKTAYKSHNVMWTDMSSATDEGELAYDPADERIDYQPELTLDEKTRQEIILEVLNTLPVDQRTVLQMYFYDGMKLQEIADELGVPMSTVTGRLQKAKTKVKASVTEIQRRDGIKLYGLTPLTFFLYLLGWWKGTGNISVPPTFVYPKAAETSIRTAVTKSAETAAEGMKAAGAKAAVKTAAAVGAKAGVPLAVKIGLGAAVAIGAVFGGSAMINAARGNNGNKPTAASGESSNGNASDKEKESGFSLFGSGGSDTAPDQQVIWAVEPSLHFERVDELIPHFGYPDSPYVTDMHMREGYPMQWNGLADKCRNDVISVRVDGKYGIYSYDGEELLAPAISADPIPFESEQPFSNDAEHWYFRQDFGVDASTGIGYNLTKPSYTLSEDFTSYQENPPAGDQGGFVIGLDTPSYTRFVMVDGKPATEEYLSGNTTRTQIPDTVHMPSKALSYAYTADGQSAGIAVLSEDAQVLFTTDRQILADSFINNYFVICGENAYKRAMMTVSGSVYDKEWTYGDHKNDRILRPGSAGDIGDTYALVNAETGEQITEMIYSRIKFFEDGYCPVLRDGKWGYIDEEGNEVTDFIFDDASVLYQGKAFVSVNGVYGIIDLSATLEEGIPVTEKTCYPNGVPEGKQNHAYATGAIGQVTAIAPGLTIYEEDRNTPTEWTLTRGGTLNMVYAVVKVSDGTWYKIDRDQRGTMGWVFAHDDEVWYYQGLK